MHCSFASTLLQTSLGGLDCKHLSASGLIKAVLTAACRLVSTGRCPHRAVPGRYGNYREDAQAKCAGDH